MDQTKRCFKCGVVKPIADFYKHPQTKDGHLNKCKECTRADVQKNYTNHIDYYHKYDQYRYRENKNRLLDHVYRGIVNRCNGVQRKYSSTGTTPISMAEWKSFCTSTSTEFDKLYDAWKKSGFQRKMAPSIDRIDNNRGYTIDNMQWLSQSDNSRKRAMPLSEWRRKSAP